MKDLLKLVMTHKRINYWIMLVLSGLIGWVIARIVINGFTIFGVITLIVLAVFAVRCAVKDMVFNKVIEDINNKINKGINEV